MSSTRKLLAIIALAGCSALWAAPTKKQTVKYICENDVNATVTYTFNAKTGFPINARVRIKGKTFTVQYDKRRSDHVDSQFSNRQGYKLSAPALTIKGVKSTSGIMIFDRDDSFLGKECNP